MQSNDKELIISVIEETIRSGFHKDFEMLVYKDDAIEKVTIDTWFKRIEQLKKNNPELWSQKTHYDFLEIDITGNAASVQLDVYKGDTFFSTDYMLLYKFKKGWKIVSKIFTVKKS